MVMVRVETRQQHDEQQDHDASGLDAGGRAPKRVQTPQKTPSARQEESQEAEKTWHQGQGNWFAF